MAERTIKRQAKDAIQSGRTLLTFDMGDLIYSFGESLSRTGLRLGKDYLSDMMGMIYTEESLKEVKAGKKKQPEVAYLKTVFEQPVAEPNGTITKRKMEINMPRFLAFQSKPLNVSDAKVSFDMNVKTVFQLEEDTAGPGSQIQNNNLSLHGSLARKTTTNKQADSESNIAMEINFKVPDENNPVQETLIELFKGITTPITAQ